MGKFLKGLKIANGKTNKVLYTDENGVLKASNKSINDIVTSDITNALDERITDLEGAVEDVGQRLQDING